MGQVCPFVTVSNIRKKNLLDQKLCEEQNLRDQKLCEEEQQNLREAYKKDNDEIIQKCNSSNVSAEYKLHHALLCDSFGAMVEQRLDIIDNEIVYNPAMLDEIHMCAKYCFKIPTVYDLLRDSKIQQEIRTIAKNKNKNSLSYEDFIIQNFEHSQ